MMRHQMILQVTSFTSSNGRKTKFTGFLDQYQDYLGIQSTNLDFFVSILGLLYPVQNTIRTERHR